MSLNFLSHFLLQVQKTEKRLRKISLPLIAFFNLSKKELLFQWPPTDEGF